MVAGTMRSGGLAMNIARAQVGKACASRAWISAVLILAATTAGSPSAAAVSEADAGQGIVECTADHLKKHNPDLAGKADRLICFQAYVSNFNTQPRQIKGKKQFLGVPHWVAHHIEKAPGAPETKARPTSWFTVPDLAKQGIAPTDDSYKFSAAFREKHKNWYERG